MKNVTALLFAVSRKLCALALTALLLVIGPIAMAQHDMSNMPGMSKPKPKAQRKVGKRQRPNRRNPASNRRRTGKPTLRNTPPAQASPPPSTTPPAAPPQMPMDMPGMEMPRATPTPLPSPGMMPGMPGMRMPAEVPRAPVETMPGMSMPGMQMPPAADERIIDPDPQIAARPILRLEDLEAMALRNNPTLAQAEAGIRAAEGRRVQAGLFPNPIVGYTLDEFVLKAPLSSAKHSGFLEQTIPLGGKLGKSRQIFARETEQAEAIADAQRIRVLNSVRVLYFEALGAQRQVELRVHLAGLTREATEITRELHNVGQADTPDQLEIEIEMQRAEIELERAQNEREEVWQALSAMVNNPDLKPSRLEGTLEAGSVALDEEQITAAVLSESPEIKVAQLGIERARAVVSRARAQRVPDLTIGGGVGYNFDRFEALVPRVGNQTKGVEARLQVGINLPIFDRNQGGIVAAEAELGIAESELQRLQLTLRTRLATALRQYHDAFETVERYRTEVIPRARAGYEMYLSNFKQMAASYPQVLIAQRTLFQVEVEYARALIQLRQSAVVLRGFLLTGGLDAVSKPGSSPEGPGMGMPNQANRNPVGP